MATPLSGDYADKLAQLGIQSGLSAQNQQRQQEQEAKLKEYLLGVQRGPDYIQDKARQNAISEAALRKTGFKLGEYDQQNNRYPIEEIPGYQDIEKEYKKAMIDFTNAKTRSENAPKEEKPPTADQFKAAGFAKRIEDAENTFSDLASKGYDPTSTKSQISRKLPEFAEGFKDTDNKLQEQAERNFVNSVLRRESGSAISPTEFASAEKQYFPRLGDSKEVLAQKKNNRTSILKALRAESGNAYRQAYVEQNPNTAISGLIKGPIQSMPPATPSAQASGLIPKVGEEKNGYIFMGGDPSQETSWKPKGK